ncbi:MAG TPA: glycosyltransferase family 1 protein [Coriobacteriia bacterium]
MKVGIVPVLDRSWGGVYQYSVTFLHALARLESDDEFVVFAPKGVELADDVRALPFEIAEMPFGPSRLGGMWSRLPEPMRVPLRRLVASMRTRRPSSAPQGSRWPEWFASLDLDLLIFTIEDDRAQGSGVPYVVVLHDIQHKLQPDLPEFADRAESERRERRVRSSVHGATLVLVDSETGREDVVSCYADTGTTVDDVWPLPFVPAHYVSALVPEEQRREVRARLALPASYLFYPAQFWPHKNHERIIESLGKLAGEGLRVPLVLVGSNAGSALRAETFATMTAAVDRLGVADLVHYLGYVPDADMSALYAMATALVMPTFFGPTNIPVVEAWELGCPVVTSDIRGIREQVGDAALLVDPSSVDSIAEGIRRVVQDADLRWQLIERGRARLSAYTMDDFVIRLGEILDEVGRRIATR